MKIQEIFGSNRRLQPAKEDQTRVKIEKDDSKEVKWLKTHFNKEYEKRQLYINTYGVNSDDGINVVIRDNMLEDGMLPVSFGTALSDFLIAPNTSLRSMEGCPKEIDGDFTIYKNTKVVDFVGAPEIVHGSFDITDSGIVDLTGINDHVKDIGEYLRITAENMKKGGIGCIFIKNCKGFEYATFDSQEEKMPFEIIMKYMRKPDKVFDCQQELIEAGFEAYAEL